MRLTCKHVSTDVLSCPRQSLDFEWIHTLGYGNNTLLYSRRNIYIWVYTRVCSHKHAHTHSFVCTACTRQHTGFRCAHKHTHARMHTHTHTRTHSLSLTHRLRKKVGSQSQEIARKETIAIQHFLPRVSRCLYVFNTDTNTRMYTSRDTATHTQHSDYIHICMHNTRIHTSRGTAIK